MRGAGKADSPNMGVGPHEMVETASTIKKEVHHELNATRQRIDNIAVTFAGCNTVTRQFELREKAEQSHAVQTADLVPL